MSLTRMLWRVIRYSPGLYLGTLVLQIARFGLLLIPALLIRELLESLQRQRGVELGWSTLWMLVGALVVVAVLRVAIIMLAVSAEHTAAQTSTSLLRRNTAEALMTGPRPSVRTGDAVGRLQIDAGLVGEALRMSFFIAGSVVTGAIALALMLRIHSGLALAATAPVLLAATLVVLSSRRVGAIGRQRRELDAVAHSFLVDVFGAVSTVQLAAAEHRVVERFRTVSEQRRSAVQSEVLFRDVIVNGVFESMRNFTIAALLLLGGRAMLSGEFSSGDFVLFMTLALPLGDTAVQLGRHIGLVPQLRVAWLRLRELAADDGTALVAPAPLYLSQPPPPLAPLPQPASDRLQALSLKQLGYRYPNGGFSLEALDLDIQAGSFTVITGPVGSGKTTLLRALLGILKASGQVEWNGRPVAEPSEFFLAPRAAYVPQVPVLFSDSLRQNISLGRPFSSREIQRATEQSMLAGDLAQLELGLDTLVGAGGTLLSGGQVQRCAAARALVVRPTLLCVDDLSSAVDAMTERSMWDELLADHSLTVIAVTNRAALIDRADNVVVLEGGRARVQAGHRPSQAS